MNAVTYTAYCAKRKAALVTGSLSFSVRIPVQDFPAPVRRYPDVAAVLPYARTALPGDRVGDGRSLRVFLTVGKQLPSNKPSCPLFNCRLLRDLWNRIRNLHQPVLPLPFFARPFHFAAVAGFSVVNPDRRDCGETLRFGQ